MFTAPFNWDWETGDKTEFNVIAEGDRPDEPCEIAEGVVIAPGSYEWIRYRAQVEFASWRKVSGAIAWSFGSFYDGNLDEIGAYIAWIGSHQHEGPIIDMSSSFNMPDITLIVRKPLRANTRNALLQYSVAIGAGSSKIFHIA